MEKSLVLYIIDSARLSLIKCLLALLKFFMRDNLIQDNIDHFGSFKGIFTFLLLTFKSGLTALTRMLSGFQSGVKYTKCKVNISCKINKPFGEFHYGYWVRRITTFSKRTKIMNCGSSFSKCFVFLFIQPLIRRGKIVIMSIHGPLRGQSVKLNKTKQFGKTLSAFHWLLFWTFCCRI